MYREFFGMKHTPFTNQIPPDALYLSDNLQEVIGRLCYVAEHQLFGVLTGDVGVGKSTILCRLSSWHQQSVHALSALCGPTWKEAH